MAIFRPTTCVMCALLLLAGCAVNGTSTDDMISMSGLKSENVVTHLKEYGKKTQYSKAFAVDPIFMDRSWAFWDHKNKQTLLEAVEKHENYAPFALGTEYVWPQYRTQYLESPKGKARVCMRDGKYREAIPHAKDMLATSGHEWYAYSLIGWAYFHLDDFEQASINFAKSLEFKAKENDSVLMLAQCAIMTSDFSEARRLLDSIQDKKFFGYRYDSREIIYYAAQQDYVTAASLAEGRMRMGMCFRVFDAGVEVTCVVPNCPAALAGLKSGDVVVEFNGLSTTDLDFDNDFKKMLYDVDFASVADIKFTRNGKTFRTQFICGITPDILEKYKKLTGVKPVEM